MLGQPARLAGATLAAPLLATVGVLRAVVATLVLLLVVLGFSRADRGLDVLERELALVGIELLRAAAELRALERRCQGNRIARSAAAG